MEVADLEQIQEKLAYDASQAAALEAAAARHARSTALDEALQLAGFGAALGVGARGLTGLYRMVANRHPAAPETSNVVKLPGLKPPETQAVEEDAEAAKTATAPQGWGDMTRWMTTAEKPENVPLGAALGMLALPAGFYAGYKGIDYAADLLREKRLDRQEQAAKARYEALLRQALQPKAAAAGAEEDPIEAGFAELKKRASVSGAVSSITDAAMQPILGPEASKQLARYYLMYAVPATAASAYMTYQALKPTQQSTVMERAIRERRRRQGLSANVPLYAEPAA